MGPETKLTNREEQWEAIVQNRQKGESFRLKFWGDPVVYEGIPVTRSGAPIETEGDFQLDVTSPARVRGPRAVLLSDVESMERGTGG